MDESKIHTPVLLAESIASLSLKEGDVVVDCTVNRGGHAEEIAKIIGKKGKLIIFDLDKNALEYSEKRLKAIKDGPQVIAIHSNYRNIKEKLSENNITQVDKIFADLGLSSQELETSGRGFSFMRDEPLLMSFDSDSASDENILTAKDLLKNLNAKQLEDIFKNYGDETRGKKIAEKIVETIKAGGEINTTKELVDIIISVTGHKPWQKSHPATKIFQALRIAVNDEYDSIKDMIKSSMEILKTGGVLSIISFHSGEDRIVKNTFNEIKKAETGKLFQKQKPKEEEIRANRRSRSALLRTVEKL